MVEWICKYKGRQKGNHGHGPVGQTFGPSPSGDAGRPGVVRRQTPTDRAMGRSFSMPFYKMLLRQAENAYLNDKRSRAGHILLWILAVLQETTIVAQAPSEITQKKIAPDTPNRAVLEPLLKRVKVLLVQMQQGVDYYGKYPDFVPLSSIVVYERAIDDMLPLAADIEKAYRAYFDDSQKAQQQRDAIEVAITSLELHTRTLAQQEQQLVDEVQDNRRQITQLLSELQVLEQEILTAKEAFVEAVESQVACGIGDVIKAGAAVASIVSGVGAVAGGIAALGSVNEMIEANETLNDWKKTGNYIAKQGKTIGGGMSDISRGYGTIKEQLEVDRDYAKLLVDKDEFDQTIAQFKNMDEAREYKRLVDQYVRIADLRNRKILETDTKISEIYDLESEREGIEVDIGVTAAHMRQVWNPRLGEHIAFFEHALDRAKADLVRAVYMQYKALEYFSLRPNRMPKNLQSRTITYIKELQRGFKSDLSRALEDRNGELQALRARPIRFDRDNHAECFQSLDEDGRFTFVVDHDNLNFRYYSQALVNEVTVTIETEDAFRYSVFAFLRHHGDATFVDRNGDLKVFSHRLRESNVHLLPGENAGTMTLGGGQYDSLLSPLSSWSFIVEFVDAENNDQTGDEEKASRANIKAVSLTFSGLGFSRHRD